jgi:3-dehydroquinate synthase
VELREALLAAARVKAAIVSADETEAGERELLNFGHTVGHALESAGGYERWTHGEAIAIGMMVAADLSRSVAGLSSPDYDELEALLRGVGLPVFDPGTRVHEVLSWMGSDKKRRGGEARFVLTPRIGSATFGHLISQIVVEQSLARFFEPSGG